MGFLLYLKLAETNFYWRATVQSSCFRALRYCSLILHNHIATRFASVSSHSSSLSLWGKLMIAAAVFHYPVCSRIIYGLKNSGWPARSSLFAVAAHPARSRFKSSHQLAVEDMLHTYTRNPHLHCESHFGSLIFFSYMILNINLPIWLDLVSIELNLGGLLSPYSN